jgi:hypothetical protein
MHYDSPHNTRKSDPKVDLFDTRKREQYAADVRLNPCLALMGHDAPRTLRYDWAKK